PHASASTTSSRLPTTSSTARSEDGSSSRCSCRSVRLGWGNALSHGNGGLFARPIQFELSLQGFPKAWPLWSPHGDRFHRFRAEPRRSGPARAVAARLGAPPADAAAA